MPAGVRLLCPILLPIFGATMLGCVPVGLSVPPVRVAGSQRTATASAVSASSVDTTTLPTERSTLVDAPSQVHRPTVSLTQGSRAWGGGREPIARRVQRGGQDVWIGGADRIKAQWIEHHGYGVSNLCPLLVVDDGASLRLSPVQAAADAESFDLSTSGRCDRTDWPTTASWLVLDRDGNGTIDDGTELFGETTPMVDGKPAANGFAALAALDDNGDGVVDGRDPQFAALRLWRDSNGDRQSQPAELSTLAQAEITSLPLTYAVDPICDDRGNCAAEHASVTTSDGRPAPTLVDVHLVCR